MPRVENILPVLITLLMLIAIAAPVIKRIQSNNARISAQQKNKSVPANSPSP